MSASPLEWLFFGGPVELMIGIPIIFCVVGFIYALIKTGIESVANAAKRSRHHEDSNR